MAKTTIGWCHYTFNPWWGCSLYSPGCGHCYAKAFAERLGLDIWGEDRPRR
jgi:protein gp37